MNHADDIPLKPHYVYVLIDPRATGDSAVFYVGKGSGERALAHGRLASRFDGEEGYSPRLHRIAQVRSAGSDVLERVVARVDTEAEALWIEAVLIDWVYGMANLTNRVSGHGHSFVRTRGDLSLRGRLDVPARQSGERTGEYSAMLDRKNEVSDTAGRLGRWREQLLDLGYDVGPIDTSNKTAYSVAVKLGTPFNLTLVARPSGNRVVKLLFTPSTRDALADYLAMATQPTFLRKLKDERINNAKSRSPYFYLPDSRRPMTTIPIPSRLRSRGCVRSETRRKDQLLRSLAPTTGFSSRRCIARKTRHCPSLPSRPDCAFANLQGLLTAREKYLV